MKIEGAQIISASREKVYQTILQPSVLAAALPGCEKLEPQPDGSYHTELKIGIGAVRGSYHGRVEIHDLVASERFRMKVEGQGTGGFMEGDGVLSFADAEGGGTEIRYSGNVEVGGIIASVGQRMIQAAARQIINQFFESFKKHAA